MSYIFDINDAGNYEQWLNRPKSQRIIAHENRLVLTMIKPRRGETVLDIGCGTGASLVPFIEAGIQATGIDPSRHMIEIASEKLKHRADLHCGYAEDLPFDDNAFHHACLIKTIEFVENPQKAIEEACRVAKDKVFIGILNRTSAKITGLRIKSIFTKTMYPHACFFSIWELRNMVRSIAGNVPITWRTVCGFPTMFGTYGYNMEAYDLIQRFPFGAFAGIMVIPVPRYRVRPLELTPSASPEDAVAGLARAEWREKT